MPTPDRHSEVINGDITTVQLPTAAKQRAFIHSLQSALGAQGSLSSLTPGPSDNVFVILQVVEAKIRGSLALISEAQWHDKLIFWGALTVNTLTRDAFFSLIERGTVVINGMPLGTAKITAAATVPAAKAAANNQILPTSFRGPFDWNLDDRGCNVIAAWQMFANNPKFSAALPWATIRIGHIDTGYTEHAALGWANGPSSTVKPAEGYDYRDGAYDPVPPDPRYEWLPGFPGHGTRISCTIAGFSAQEPSQPFFGVAPGVTVVPYRVTDSVIIDHVKGNVAKAIRKALADNCHIINISLGALFGSKALADALDYAYDNGVIVCCTAGQVWGEVIDPGRYNRCITMGGIGPGLQPRSSGAKGQYVDLCGPADVIRRVKAEHLPAGQAARGIYPKADGDGTSYATATCSGIAALWLAWHGADTLKNRFSNSGPWQIPKAFKQLAWQTATPGGWVAADIGNYGSGVLNAAKLLAGSLPGDGSMTKALLAADVFENND